MNYLADITRPSFEDYTFEDAVEKYPKTLLAAVQHTLGISPRVWVTYTPEDIVGMVEEYLEASLTF